MDEQEASGQDSRGSLEPGELCSEKHGGTTAWEMKREKGGGGREGVRMCRMSPEHSEESRTRSSQSQMIDHFLTLLIKETEA